MGGELSPVVPIAGKADMAPHNPPGIAGPPPSGHPQEQPQAPEQDEIPPIIQSQPAAQNAFAAQLDVASPQQPGRQGAYNMVPVANALPQVPYRSAHYPSGSQQRYNPTTSPHMMSQMPQMPQYGPSHSMPMVNQGYYGQPPPHMPQYYGGGHMSTTHAQSSMPPRQNVPYYPNQMVMSHSQTPYYYPHHTAQYPTSNQGIPNNMAPHGQYMPGSPTTATDHRIAVQSPDLQQNGQFQGGLAHQELISVGAEANTKGLDGPQNAVRGPPRKPRQSGKTSSKKKESSMTR